MRSGVNSVSRYPDGNNSNEIGLWDGLKLMCDVISEALKGLVWSTLTNSKKVNPTRTSGFPVPASLSSIAIA